MTRPKEDIHVLNFMKSVGKLAQYFLDVSYELSRNKECLTVICYFLNQITDKDHVLHNSKFGWNGFVLLEETKPSPTAAVCRQ